MLFVFRWYSLRILMVFCPCGSLAHTLSPTVGLRRSGQQLGDHFAFDISQAEVASLEAVGELGVIKPEQMEQGGMQVVDVDLVLGDMEAEFIGFTQGHGGVEAAAGPPPRQGLGLGVATRSDAPT